MTGRTHGRLLQGTRLLRKNVFSDKEEKKKEKIR
jgi:hypothetical protein